MVFIYMVVLNVVDDENHGVLQHVTKLSTTDIKFEVNGKMGFVSQCYIIKNVMVRGTKALIWSYLQETRLA